MSSLRRIWAKVLGGKRLLSRSYRETALSFIRKVSLTVTHLSDAGPGPELELCGAVLVEVLGDHIRRRLRDPAPGDFSASPHPF